MKCTLTNPYVAIGFQQSTLPFQASFSYDISYSVSVIGFWSSALQAFL